MMKTFVRPTFDRILIRQDAAIQKTEGGIELPAASQEAPKEGTVVAVGPQVDSIFDPERDYPSTQYFRLGNRVGFGTYAGKDITIDGEVFKLLKQDEIEYVLESIEVPDPTPVETV